jgi:hypothetical protein
VVLDGNMQELELADDVCVIVDRYRLTSEHLKLRRGPRGVHIEGEGSVALCPCDDAPVTLGFASATVAPPTDLLVESPTVRVGRVPVLWMPYLWLRSPDRAGLLPPRLAWRGPDGLLVGAGAHLPLGGAPRARSSYADVMLSGYTRGGAEVAATVGTPDSATWARWDHIRSSFVDLDSHGAIQTSGTTGAWQVTAIRGERARGGSVDLRAASMPYDRMELSVHRVHDVGLIGVGVRGVASRAGPFSDLGLVGPKLSLAATEALDGYGTADAVLQAWTPAASRVSTSTYALHGAGLRIDARPGPMTVAAVARERALAVTTADESGVGLAAGMGSQVSLPLVRSFGAGPFPIWHWVSPFARLDGALTSRVGQGQWPLPAADRWVSALAGVRTAVENRERRAAWDLRVSGGWVGRARDASAATAAKLVSTGSAVNASLTVASLLADRSILSSSRASVRLPESVIVSGSVEGRNGPSASRARWLDAAVWDAPWLGWYSLSGWSAGVDVVVPWTRWLASSVSVDHDLSADRWLGQRSSVAYRHPCGCLAVVGEVGRRLGREGIDASVTLDLVP